MAYTTAANLKTYLGITEATDDTLLGTLITAAQAMIDAHCGQTFEASADSTRYFYAMSVDEGGHVDGRDLILDAPLCAITSVTNGDGVVVASGDYLTLPRNETPYYALRLTVSSGLTWTYDDDVEADAIEVVGKWAYSTAAPADIAQTTIRLAAYLYRQKNNSSDLDRAIAIGSNAMLLPPELPRDIKTLLRHYVRAVA